VSDTSDIPTHVFTGQFYKWTIQLELQDGFLFSIPQKQNWRFIGADLCVTNKISDAIIEDTDVPIDITAEESIIINEDFLEIV
jgi:hypothetical protein